MVFPLPVAPRHEHVLPFVHGPLDEPARHPLEEPSVGQAVDRGSLVAWQPDGDRRPVHGHRSEHRVHTDPVSVPDVGAGCGLVDVPSAAGDQGTGEVAGAVLRQDESRHDDQPGAPVGPDAPSAQDQYVRHAVVGDQGRELLEVDQRRGTPPMVRRRRPGQERSAMAVHGATVRPRFR
ncbi:hypothetical protein [Curtobacterium sp. MCJR17_043]|uniref:hypothetical protein n=1 Tax=Curtobacterium sp. MCJR17_043 TaxID=2175660 RepID=UPI0024DF69D2|nr:hypothetical protein [Curtobacterium sp. MCJR17_043]WIB35329.1 hypothetical protein DEJ15_13600 [Curtobacterium sp. MCJR17_043]